MNAETVKGASLSYILMKPNRVRPTVSYPLVILMHAFGTTMYDLVGIASGIDDIHYMYACPNGPFKVKVGFGTANGWLPEAGGLEAADDVIAMLEIFIAEVQERSGVAAGKVVLAGFGEAGELALSFGLKRPGVFKGLACVGPLSSAALADAAAANETRVLIAETSTDAAQLERARAANALLEGKGYAVEYHEYASVAAPDATAAFEGADNSEEEGYSPPPTPHPEHRDLVAWIKETVPPPPRY